MKFDRRRSAFTLLEIFVIIGIIAMFLALLVPFILKLKEGGRSEICVANLKQIGQAIKRYAAEHNDQLPGPLSDDQYPVDSAGNPPRDGQLLKYIATYLNAPAGSPEPVRSARNTFTFPAWQNAERTTDAPVFLANNDEVEPHGQSAWGGNGKVPLKFADLKNWTRKIGDKVEPVLDSKVWAITENDQEITKLLGINAPWVQRTPAKPVHVTHRNALYFDMHVDQLVLTRSGAQLEAQLPR